MKEKILLLKSQGLSYNQISTQLGCSRSLVCYYLGTNQKEKTLERQNKRRSIIHPYKKKLEYFLRKPRNYKSRNNQILKFKSLIYYKIRCFLNYPVGEIMAFNHEDIIKKFGENPKCYLTGDDINIYEPRTYQFDHIIPKSRGGQNTLDNLQLCTKQSNYSKRDMTPDEYFNLCKKVLENNGYKVEKM